MEGIHLGIGIIRFEKVEENDVKLMLKSILG